MLLYIFGGGERRGEALMFGHLVAISRPMIQTSEVEIAFFLSSFLSSFLRDLWMLSKFSLSIMNVVGDCVGAGTRWYSMFLWRGPLMILMRISFDLEIIFLGPE